MTQPDSPKDLLILVADLDQENAIRGILARHHSLGISEMAPERFDVRRHPYRDSGCRAGAERFLQIFADQYRFALVVFDRAGCGDDRAAEAIEREMEDRLRRTGWPGRSGAVVIDPELEAWVWSDSPHVDQELGWSGRQPPLRQWLVERRFARRPGHKPENPKKAMQEAMREARKPGTSGIFLNLAKTVGLSRCQDRAFLKLKQLLRQWFAA
jgi:hypothetical protein